MEKIRFHGFFITLQSHIRKIASARLYFDTEEISIYCPLSVSYTHLIVGLPGESYDDVEHTMKELEAMAPDSVTVHSLAIKRAARLSLFKDKYEEMGLENNMQIMDMTARYLSLIHI